MPYLLDTNILSELRKGSRGSPRVLEWAQSTRSDRHYISVLSLAEIRRGIEILRRKAPDQCPAFERWLDHLREHYQNEILTVGEEIADRWGRMQAERSLPVLDGLIAATASVHGLTVATRNVADYQNSGVDLVNPFDDI